MVSQEEGNKLWSSFLNRWPIEALQKMTLEEYSTTGDEDCFTYWVEHRLSSLGSIRGGSSFKFGVFHRNNAQEKENGRGLCYSNKYAWYEKYGGNEHEAFSKVRSTIVDIAKYAKDGKFAEIEKITFAQAYKWKIAALYQNRDNPTIVNIFKLDNLKAYLGIDKNKAFFEMYAQIRAKHPDTPIFNLGQLVWDESKKALGNSNLADELDDKDFDDTPPQDSKVTSLNQIFYGPPGTGKTYNTINAALDIIDPESLSINDRPAIKERFDQLVSEKRIGFVTFHQSFSYEDFVEGLKPELGENGTLNYIVADGLFKIMCNLASSRVDKETDSEISLESRRIWKMSLGNTLGDDAYVYDECIENDYVLLGYGGDIDFSGCSDRHSIIEKFNQSGYEVKNSSYDVTSVHTFINKIKTGDIIVISDGNTKYRAIAEVTGDYQYLKDDDRNGYFQSRPVQWLKTFTPSRPREEIFKKAISQMTIYELRHKTLNMDNLTNILAPKTPEKQPYVLIIDEINRGNTASIFGELITLIEASKRTGAEEALSVMLPYSKEPFSVPDNLYIIGTMNTADRSLSLIDTALRRRFKFKEMLPDYSVLKDIEVDGIDIPTMLERMNQRIEALFDREHILGHAFFLPLKKDNSMSALQSIFEGEIIPLLKEYFFEDWSKIQLVLGDNQKPKPFCMIVSNQQDNLFGNDEDVSIPETYSINNAALSQPESYMGIYNPTRQPD